MDLRKSRKKEIWKYFLPPVLTVAVLMVVLAIYGVYPFGDSYIIINDMGVAEMPTVMYVSDILHGKAGLFYDWFSAGGTGRFALPLLLDPINVLTALLPKAWFVNASSFWIVSKFALISACAFPFFKKAFPSLPYYFQLLFTQFYTMSAYTLRYFQNVSFLNFVALLPLLVLAAFALFKEKKYLPFIVCLSYILITSVYFSFFIVLFLIIAGAFFIYSFYEKEERGKMAFRLGAATGASLFISASTFIPALFSLVGGVRFENQLRSGEGSAETGAAGGILNSFKEILLTENNSDVNKLLMIFGLEFCLAILLIMLFRINSDKKHTLFFIFSAVIFILPIAFENINLIWHGGSYNGYSMRYGFMLIFILLCAAAYFFEKSQNTEEKAYRHRVTPLVQLVAAFFSGLIALCYYVVAVQNGINRNTLSSRNDLIGPILIKSYLPVLLLLTLTFLIILLFKNKKLRNALSAVIMCALLLSDSYLFFGSCNVKPDDMGIKYIEKGTELSAELYNDNKLMRFADKDGSLNMNLCYALSRSSVGGWTHSINNETKRSFTTLGYTAEYTVTADTGATPFADSLMNITDYIGKTTYNTALYNYKKTLNDEFNLYSPKYSLPFGVQLNGELVSNDNVENTFEYQNALAKAIAGADTELFKKAEYTAKSYEKKTYLVASDTNEVTEGSVTVREYNLKASDGQLIFMAYNDIEGIINDDIDYNQFSVYVNDTEFFVPYFIDTENTMYPVAYNNSTVKISDGTAGDYTVKLESRFKESDYSKIVFYTMDIADYSSVCETAKSVVTDYSTTDNGVSITLDGTGTGDGYMFIPLKYDGNWHCTADGTEVKIEKTLGNFMAVKIEEGKTDVEFKYVPTGAIKSIVGFVAALLIVLIIFFAAKRKGFEPGKKLCTAAKAAFAAVFAVTMLIVYAVPIIAQLFMVLT